MAPQMSHTLAPTHFPAVYTNYFERSELHRVVAINISNACYNSSLPLIDSNQLR